MLVSLQPDLGSGLFHPNQECSSRPPVPGSLLTLGICICSFYQGMLPARPPLWVQAAPCKGQLSEPPSDLPHGGVSDSSPWTCLPRLALVHLTSCKVLVYWAVPCFVSGFVSLRLGFLSCLCSLCCPASHTESWNVRPLPPGWFAVAVSTIWLHSFPRTHPGSERPHKYFYLGSATQLSFIYTCQMLRFHCRNSSPRKLGLCT